MQKRPTSPTTPGSRLAQTAAVSIALASLAACAANNPAKSGADWRRSHKGLDNSLVRTVNWPGAKVSRVEGDIHGFRTVLKFSGDDSDMGAFVQIEPATANPCAAAPYFVTDTGTYHPDPKTYGDTAFTKTACVPDGKNAWTLINELDQADGYTSYAERRDGILLILTTNDTWTDPNFKAIAATLHHLDDKQLGSIL